MIDEHRSRGGIVVASSHGDLDLPDHAGLDMSALRAAA
jgi:ABC-type transport system involved in cytochrome c biogenesis ATPase subunit